MQIGNLYIPADINEYITYAAMQWRSLDMTTEKIELLLYIAITLGAITALIGIANLRNQRKIKKQLRQLLEERKKEEDKP